MSLYVSSLNSGSNGNCFYIGNEKESILIDAGISCKEIEKRMKRLDLSMKKIKAVFVTHEHTDHIKGISVLSKKYQIPVYITKLTQQSGGVWIEKHLSISFKGFEPVQIGSLNITAIPKYHDAADPYSFIVSCDQVKVGVFTDTGTTCENLVNHFTQCHAAFLESNYDEDMLENGSYPYHLKKRIRSGSGHLSNSQALHLFKQHRPSFMSHLFLSHLSKNNNCPDLVTSLFNRHAGNTSIIVASRHHETPVYRIANEAKVREHVVGQLQFEF